jgi:hypothetical protein
MKDGEYVGKDGRPHRWARYQDKYQHEVGMDCTALGERERSICWATDYTIATADWPAAKLTLDALIEAEAGEWDQVDEHTRYNPKSGKWQMLFSVEPIWRDHTPSDEELEHLLSFERGLRAGREEARELAEAHLYCVEHEDDCGSCLVLPSECIALAKRLLP